MDRGREVGEKGSKKGCKCEGRKRNSKETGKTRVQRSFDSSDETAPRAGGD